MALIPFLGLPSPTQFSNFDQVGAYLRRTWETLQAMRRGKIECMAELTLTANAASSTLSDIRIGKYSALIFDPLTANAAAELAAGTLYVTTANRTDGSATVEHANNAQVDRSYRIIIIG